MVIKFISSWNLGVWRGAWGKKRTVRLAPGIDLGSYAAGFEYGQANSRAIRAKARVAPKAKAA